MDQKIAGGENGSVNGDAIERMFVWEEGLPDYDKITPLSQVLIPQKLASAFRILMEPCRTLRDVDLASKTSLLNIRDGQFQSCSDFESSGDQTWDQEEDAADPDGSGSRKVRKVDSDEHAKLASRAENPTDAATARTLKRPRLAWTPQLHKRFVAVVSHLGLKDAVPKNIMQLMNVEGLTRENVASHLQKYRLFLRRTQVSSTSDDLLVPIPVLQNSPDPTTFAVAHRNGFFPAAYMPPPMMPMMYFGVGAYGHGHRHTSMPMANLGTELNSARLQD